MGSRKRAAKVRQIAAFKAGLGAGGIGGGALDDGLDLDGILGVAQDDLAARRGATDDLFAREAQRKREKDAQRDAVLREKACESKNRYATLADAEEAIASCAAHGTRGLHSYRCPHCNGWHLTSKPQR